MNSGTTVAQIHSNPLLSTYNGSRTRSGALSSFAINRGRSMPSSSNLLPSSSSTSFIERPFPLGNEPSDHNIFDIFDAIGGLFSARRSRSFLPSSGSSRISNASVLPSSSDDIVPDEEYNNNFWTRPDALDEAFPVEDETEFPTSPPGDKFSAVMAGLQDAFPTIASMTPESITTPIANTAESALEKGATMFSSAMYNSMDVESLGVGALASAIPSVMKLSNPKPMGPISTTDSMMYNQQQTQFDTIGSGMTTGATIGSILGPIGAAAGAAIGGAFANPGPPQIGSDAGTVPLDKTSAIY